MNFNRPISTNFFRERLQKMQISRHHILTRDFGDSIELVNLNGNTLREDPKNKKDLKLSHYYPTIIPNMPSSPYLTVDGASEFVSKLRQNRESDLSNFRRRKKKRVYQQSLWDGISLGKVSK